MKKIISFLASFCTVLFFAQGKLNVFNFTQYNLHYTLVASSTNSNCLPNLTGNNYAHPVAPGDNLQYDNCYLSNTISQSPINRWVVQLPSGVTLPPTGAASLSLQVYNNITRWQMAKFEVRDLNGGIVPNGGGTIGTINCNANFVGYLDPATYAFEAIWFVANNETFFVVQ
jgi:hypothetical protein